MSAVHRVAIAITLTTVFAATAGCAGQSVKALHGVLVGEHAQAVAPGQLFGGQFLEVHAPDSPGWVLLRESTQEITFGRPGAAEGESYVATVSFFELPVTKSRDEFIATIRQGRESDSSPERFADVSVSYGYAEERGYPCASYRSSSLDLKAPGGALTLAEGGMYCRHPRRDGLGFWVSYSQRAKETDDDFAEQADGFVRGVTVPDGRAAQ
jgi:hypothetical protein